MKKQFSFYKNKACLIVLIVIFTLLLVADVLVGSFASSMNRGFGGNRDFSQMQGMPSGGNFEFDGEGNPFGGEMPSGGDFEFDGEGNPFGGEMPSGGDFEFDGENMPSMGNMSSGMGFLQFIGTYWILIAVILAVLDGLCIFMLIRIIRNDKNHRIPRIEKKQEEEYVESVHTPKEYPILNKIKEKMAGTKAGRIFLQLWEKVYDGPQRMVAVGMTVILLLVLIVSATGDTTEVVAQTEATVYSGTVEKGEIITSVPGTGTLTDEEGENLELPVGVELIKRYVSNGDAVVKGQKIALVDTVSVMSSIANIQDLLDDLDNELEDHEEETISENVKSGTDGKIKVIYAEEGVDVLETMYEYGALMLVSLDGMMAVAFETDVALSVGESLVVTTEDGDTLDGKVQSITKGEVVVTVSDDASEYGETVTVATEDGTSIGTGSLYIHSELKVTGYAGTVSSILAGVNDEVDEGDTLLELSNTEYDGEYESLLAKRAELEGMMQELLQIYQDQYIYAKADGVISGLDEDAVSLASVESTSVGLSAQNPSGTDMGSMIQGGTGLSTGDNVMSQEVEEEQTFEIETTTCFSIIPQNEVTISISVDEMDIRSIQTGQSVEITVDAFPGQSFSGIVSAIDYNGTNSGGSTKYSVVISMERQENMLAGMNASVAIQIEKTEDLLVIPVNALVEDETGLYVYTSYDEKKQEFGNPVVVTTGVSDGEYVEILSGLDEGSSYWYSILDVVNYSISSAVPDGFRF